MANKKIKLSKSTLVNGDFERGGAVLTVSDKEFKRLKDGGFIANEKETVIVKDEAQTLEIETLKEDKQKLSDDNDSKTLEIDTLKELLKVAIDSAKGTIPDGAEPYLEVDLTK